jgi:hypothetical protein
MYRTANRAVNWTAISPDLTDGPVPGFSAFATITTIDAAKTDSNTILVGTDDANAWVTTDRGTSWTNISAGLPNRWITRVRFDPTNHTIAYVTCSGYRVDSRLPHIFRTTDLGQSWADISSNLPEAPINVVLVDPQHTERLYVGTDVGAYFTTNTGAAWSPMGTGLPNAAVSDMQLHAPTRIVRAFTHGRSMWQINIDELTAVEVAQHKNLPVTFDLLQNYPNPFNPNTIIGYQLSREATVQLVVHDVSGKEVRTLVDGIIRAGQHSVSWNGTGQSGTVVSSGVYFCRLTVSDGATQEHRVRRMLLVK